MKGLEAGIAQRYGETGSLWEVAVAEDGCEECRSRGDVFVDGRLFCARCALANHLAAVERLESTARDIGIQ